MELKYCPECGSKARYKLASSGREWECEAGHEGLYPDAPLQPPATGSVIIPVFRGYTDGELRALILPMFGVDPDCDRADIAIMVEVPHEDDEDQVHGGAWATTGLRGMLERCLEGITPDDEED